jgi:hypothetical protein
MQKERPRQLQERLTTSKLPFSSPQENNPMERVRDKEFQSNPASELFSHYYPFCSQPFICTGYPMEPAALSYSAATHLHYSAAPHLYYNLGWAPQPLPQPSLSWLPPPFAPASTTSMEQPGSVSFPSTYGKQKEKPFQQLNHQSHALLKKHTKKLPKYKHKKISTYNKK